MAARVLFVAAMVVVACGDPVRDRATAALPAEVPGVPKGPLHRPGQPCLVCHSEAGGKSVFSLAGTVFVSADSSAPIEDVSVNMVDSLGRKFKTVTNCAGNFMVRPEEYSPHPPIWVGLQRGDVFRDMNTVIYREGSCAACHYEPPGPASAGRVYLADSPEVAARVVSRCR